MPSIKFPGMLLVLVSLVGCASEVQRQPVEPVTNPQAQEQSPTKKEALPTFTYRPG
jgi:hypothetical protein